MTKPLIIRPSENDISNYRIHPSCFLPPPIAEQDEPTVQDPCTVVLSIEEAGAGHDQARNIRFDRRGKKFVLSNLNSVEDITWVQQHPNRPDIQSYFENIRNGKNQPASRHVSVRETTKERYGININTNFLGGIRLKNGEDQNSQKSTAILGGDIAFTYQPELVSAWGFGAGLQYLYFKDEGNLLHLYPALSANLSFVEFQFGLPLGVHMRESNTGFSIGLKHQVQFGHQVAMTNRTDRFSLIGAGMSLFYEPTNPQERLNKIFFMTINPVGFLMLLINQDFSME